MGTVMNIFPRNALVTAFAAFVAVAMIPVGAYAEMAKGDHPDTRQVITAGQKMYREGQLPNGKPMQTVSADNVEVSGSIYSCAGCHQRSGLGAYDEIRYPAVSAGKLFQPLYSGPEYTPAERARLNKYLQRPLIRSAYNDASLANAIRNGKNPDGRTLNNVMPRYNLDDGDMNILVAYLRSLSADLSPGITDTTIRFATVIAGDVATADRKEMLGLMDSIVAFRNKQAKESAVRKKYASAVEEIDLYTRKISIARWELKGSAETWRSQLEAYYRREPVFALLGGITGGEWKPVHDFCEQNMIPALFPITDLPVVAKDNWYTFYFSKGLLLEGEASAAYLAETAPERKDGSIVMLVENSVRGRALTDGFDRVWQEQAQKPVVKYLLQHGEILSEKAVKDILEQEKPSAIVLWSSSGAMRMLESLSGSEGAPPAVLMSSTLAGGSLKSFPDRFKKFSYFSHPYKLAPLDRQNDPDYMALRSWLYNRKISVGDQRIATRQFPLMNILIDGLMHMKRNYYRDHFLEVVSMGYSKKSVEYDKLSFGQDERFASRNCYIMQLSTGKKPKMIKISEWISP